MSTKLISVTPRDGGKQLDVCVQVDGNTYDGILGRELLDDELRNEAAQHEREQYLEANLEKVGDALVARSSGGFLMRPFDRVVLTSVNGKKI